ncbi:MAG: sodium:proton antiporter, partial [Pseudomonadales bacterium]|nr:sodium:proton antiporter [Pseudomonadales bacterium]
MDIQNTWLVLLPAVITVCVAVVSRRPIESLLAGILVGLLMLGPTTALDQFSNMLLEVMMSETIAWVIIVCGLMGSLIMLLLRVGSVDAFSEALAAKAKSSKSALMYTWLLGIIVFIDDYLNALAVGAAMRKVTDQFGVSREKLAYVVDSTAAPICVLVPISTWAVFYASLFQESGFAEPGQGMDLYISAIPYMIYPIVAVLLVPLVALEVIPAFGPMKAAELRSAQSPLRQPATLTDEDNTQEPDREVRLYHFLLPLATLIG